jgi:hypothetical protein
MCARSVFVFSVLGFLAIVGAGEASAGERLPQPQPVQAFPDSDTEYSGFSTTGRISDVNRRVAKVTIHSATPFYAPWNPSVAICALWPTSAPLIVHVSNGVRITIDGKKAGLDQLAVGQTVAIEYSIYVFFKGGNEVFCGARKIAAWTTAPTKSH